MSDQTVGPVRDARRPPFCYQTHDALDAIRAHFAGPSSYGKLATAISVYVALTEAANRAGGATARGGFRAARKDVAKAAGVSPDSLDKYVPELVAAGVLEVERQEAEGVALPNRWVLAEPGERSATGSPRSRVGSATPSRVGSATRARQDSELQKTGVGASAPPPSAADPVPPSAPPLHLVGSGRNLALDALADVCGIRTGSPRMMEAVVALNGSKKQGTQGEGIRDLAWREALNEFGLDDDALRARVAENPEQFEGWLAAAVQRKAQLWQRRHPALTFVPDTIRRYWLDLEASAPGARMTTADLEAWARSRS